jgi:pimeloyl-ACP methyl ester carboxylesterase
MATFVLVHGGWHGGWCWKEVAALLRAAGHEVWTPTLTGLGERAHLLTPATDLALHIRDVTIVLEYEELGDAILVGHSYGGMVITGVADRAPDRIARLVYLDAFVPTDGQALFDLLRPERRAFFQEQADLHGDGWRVPPPSASALGIADESVARWLTAKMTPQPLKTFTQPLALTNPVADAIPRTFIHCSAGPMTASFVPFAAHARITPDWQYHELAVGHDAMLIAPADLADLLVAQA